MSKDQQNKPWEGLRLTYNLETILPYLLRAGEMSEAQVKAVNGRAEEYGLSLTDPRGLDFLIKLGLSSQKGQKERARVTEEVVLKAVGEAHGLEYKRVDHLDLDMEVSTRTISESFARKNGMVPLRIQEGELELLVFNPFRPELWQDMGRVSPLPYRVFLGTRAEIERLIDDFFQFGLAIQAAEMEFSGGDIVGNLESRIKVSEKSDPSSQKHIIKAVDYLLQSALRERASDIHLEPKRDKALVRFRIDGMLHTLYHVPSNVYKAMLSRIKSVSRLDISEKRRPQDGRVQLMLNNVPTDVRISTIPVAFGEKMVLRLLSSETTLKNLDQLGMTAAQFKIFTTFLGHTHGLILVTGPTGSGKSTTLYSALKDLAKPTINVVTVEDPIEMVVDDFNQIGVQRKIDVTFGQMLRHILRQDPDIIMIGEMRDLETAEQAIQAALTGHLVFSTLHTNDATSSLTRLLDLGLQSYLINASLIGVVAQRLVRTICPHCIVPLEFTQDQLRVWGVESLVCGDTAKLWRGAGCEHCRRTGFLGRTGIYEILPFDVELKEAVRQGMELDALRTLVRKKGIESLFNDGISKALKGVTTVEEVLRVAGATQE